MLEIDFSRLVSIKAISINFGQPIDLINEIIQSPENHYIKLEIPKKGKQKGKYRTVYKANETLARFHSDIKKQIELKIYQEDKTVSENYITRYANAFVKRRGTKRNAKHHLNKEAILNIDIKNFFKSINTNAIKEIFIKLGTPENGAETLAKLITLNDRLEEGLRCSPLMSNIFCRDMDIKLAKFGQEHGCTYSRYADDITFSTNNRLPKLNLIVNILNEFGFNLNETKTKYSKRGTAQYVTGLSVSDDKHPRIPKPIKRQIRQKLYYMKKFGYTSHFKKVGISEKSTRTELIHLYGWIQYVSSIEPLLGKKYAKEFMSIIRQGI